MMDVADEGGGYWPDESNEGGSVEAGPLICTLGRARPAGERYSNNGAGGLQQHVKDDAMAIRKRLLAKKVEAAVARAR